MNLIDCTEFISKLDVEDKTIYAKVTWKNNDQELFSIKIYDGPDSWAGIFFKESAEKYQEKLDETKEEYYENVMKSLKGHCDTYQYSFTQNGNSSNFKWLKKYEGSSALRVHGSLHIYKDVESESKDVLIDFLLHENIELRETIDKQQERNEALNLDLEKCKAELEKFVNSKSSLESSLYGKFVQLLNTKKKRIQLLEQNLQKYEPCETTID